MAKGLRQERMNMLTTCLIACLPLLGVTPAIAQITPAQITPGQITPAQAAPVLRLTIERLFDDPALTGPVPRSATFSPDGKLVTWLRPNDQDFLRLDLWAVSTTGGAPFMLVDSKALVPTEGALSEAEKARRERQRIASSSGIVSYDWDQKGEAILVPLGGDIYYVPVATPASPRRLTTTTEFETDAQVSPSGGYVSFIRNATLVAINLASGVETPLSPVGSGTLSYGMAEFIAQEEMDRDTGYWWSPDDSKIVFARVDEGSVSLVPRVEIGATSTAIIEQRYPRAGATNATVSLFVRDIVSGSVKRVDLGSDGDIYVARVNWSKDGKTLYVQRQNRAQTRLDIVMVDPESGQSRVILTETDTVWLNLTKDFTPLKSGDFLWTSERTGWRHIERRKRDGTSPVQLTSGNWPVGEIAGVDEASGKVYFTSNKDDTLAQGLYVANLARQSVPSAITRGSGTWGVKMANGGKSFLGTYSNPDTPPQLGIFSATGALVRYVEENKLGPNHPWHPYLATRAQIRFGSFKGPSGDDLNWSMHLPPGFDPAKKWPVIVYVYGGPGVQVVQRNWGSNTDQLHAARGYIMFRLDNRGTPNRGRSFERAIARDLGGPEVIDQLAGLEFLKTQSFVDPDRIGVWGWSYGGYMALRLATQAPQAFKAYVAGAPVTDWRLYDTHYTERFMGTPQSEPAAYERSSVLPDLKNVKAPLLILHGMADDNVTFDNSTAAFDALQAASVPFESMVYPGQKHGIRDKARAKHVQATILNFFDRNLGPGPK